MRLGLVSGAVEVLRRLDHRMTWHMDTAEREVFLTFDDGPMPGLTPWVLETLARYGAKATFFCIGGNVAAHPDLFQRVVDAGHAVGNHTHGHESGWTTSRAAYLRSVNDCQRLTRTDLFRPPYGRITGRQIRGVRGAGLRLIMWDVLSGDFQRSSTGERVAAGVLRRARPGSIIVFHDNAVSEPRVRVALPLVLEGLAREGYRFSVLPSRPLDAMTY